VSVHKCGCVQLSRTEAPRKRSASANCTQGSIALKLLFESAVARYWFEPKL